MTRRTYAAELGRVLEPLGFQPIPTERAREREWTRVHGDWRETVHLQVSANLGTTANLYVRDLALDRLFREATGHVQLPENGVGIGHLIDGYDRWWSRDPNGPRELAEAIARHAPAHFAKVIAQRSTIPDAWRTNTREWSWAPDLIPLALRFYKDGDQEEALRVINRKIGKLTSPSWREILEKTRRWLESAPAPSVPKS